MRNKYPGKCYQCGLWVEVGEGHFERHLSGWRVQHASCCLESRKKAKAMLEGYAASPRKVAAILGTSEEEGKKLLNSFLGKPELPEMPKFKYYAVIDVGIPGSMPEFFPHEFSAETEADLRNKTYASTGVKAQAVVMCKDQYQIYRSLENQK
jgi:hypothetical protein